MFDFVHKTLDQMTFTIQPFVIGSLSLFAFRSLMRGNDWFHFLQSVISALIAAHNRGVLVLLVGDD
jgi:hypothetical protein